MTDMQQPTTPDAAQARLGELRSDQAWGAKLLAGDADAHSEFMSLTTLATSAGPAPAAGSTEAMAAASSKVADDRNLASFLDGVRSQFPVNDAVAEEIANRPPVTKAEQDLGRQWLDQLKNDHERSRKLLAGDPEMKRQMLNASILVNSDLKPEALK